MTEESVSDENGSRDPLFLNVKLTGDDARRFENAKAYLGANTDAAVVRALIFRLHRAQWVSDEPFMGMRMMDYSIVDCLRKRGGTSIDVICRETNLDVELVLAQLKALEGYGMVMRHGRRGNWWWTEVGDWRLPKKQTEHLRFMSKTMRKLKEENPELSAVDAMKETCRLWEKERMKKKRRKMGRKQRQKIKKDAEEDEIEEELDRAAEEGDAIVDEE